MFERFRKNVTKAVKESVTEEAVKSLDDILPVVAGLASVIGLCIGMFGKTRPIGTTITINNYYYGRR